MKKILAILVALLAALSVQTVAFADGEMMPLQPTETQSETNSGTAVSVGDPITVDEINYTVLTVPSGEENGTVEVGRNRSRGNITIPATITGGENTYTVTSIGNYAFSWCSGLTSVDIPDGVTSIGNSAFRYCDSLKSITFEGTVPENWGDIPFYGCDAVKTVYLSDDLTAEERAEWEEVLKRVIPEGCQIEYTDLTPDPEPTPTTPPADNNTAAEAASTPTVQQLEADERSDPQDVEATERYHFWMGVKSDLRAAADGKTLRVHVPADYTNMPASVMEQIRLLDTDVTVDLRWNGERLTITPATAQRKTALKAFWTFAQLCELYAQ